MSEQKFLKRHKLKILPILLALGLGIAILVFWNPLIDWFTPGNTVSTETSLQTHEHTDHSSGSASNRIAYYTCSMHPSVKQEGPGQCPICNMDLTPVLEEEISSGVILIDETRVQNIGIRTGKVITKPLRLEIRTVGEVTYDESRLHEITLRLGGFIERLYVDETGSFVKKGQTLLTLYSPELYAAQQDYLLALESQKVAQSSGAPERADYLVRATKKKLKLLGLSQGQIQKIATRGEFLENVPLLSPVEGYIIEKDVVEGAAVAMGQRLFRVAKLDRIWVEAEVYETDLAYITKEQKAKVTLSSLPGKEFEGIVTHIYPFLEGKTRTGRVRIELQNPEVALKPEMYADIEFVVEKGEQLLVPASAVLYTGPRQIVFIVLEKGKFQPKEVKLGAKNGEFYEVLEGLEDGQEIVTSGNFLIAAESRLKSATDLWGGDNGSQ